MAMEVKCSRAEGGGHLMGSAISSWIGACRMGCLDNEVQSASYSAVLPSAEYEMNQLRGAHH